MAIRTPFVAVGILLAISAWAVAQSEPVNIPQELVAAAGLTSSEPTFTKDVLPIIQDMEGISLLWFVVLMAVVLQTSFLTPPFGYALFYLRAIAPSDVRTGQIIKGVLPFIGLIVVMCVVVALFPPLVTWLPETLYTK